MAIDDSKAPIGSLCCCDCLSLCCATGLRALIYSGVMDMAVPHTGSEAWTAAMHRSNSAECRHASKSTDTTLAMKCQGITVPWAPWYNSESPAQVRDACVDLVTLSAASATASGRCCQALTVPLCGTRVLAMPAT